MQKFTQNDLMLYAFDEAESDLKMAIEKALPNDLSLQLNLKQLKSELNEIQEISLEPSDRRMKQILSLLREEHSVETSS